MSGQWRDIDNTDEILLGVGEGGGGGEVNGIVLIMLWQLAIPSTLS